MAAAIAGLLSMLIVLAAYGVFLFLWMRVIRWLRLRRRGLWGAATVPVFAILLIVLWNRHTSPAGVFRYEFGFDPPPSVRLYESSYYCLGDVAHSYLHFSADNATIQRIIAAKGLGPISSAPKGRGMSTCNADPAWWTAAASSSKGSLFIVHRSRNFATEEEVLIYDRASGEAFFRFLGVD